MVYMKGPLGQPMVFRLPDMGSARGDGAITALCAGAVEVLSTANWTAVHLWGCSEFRMVVLCR
jgi:hypothetical protein